MVKCLGFGTPYVWCKEESGEIKTGHMMLMMLALGGLLGLQNGLGASKYVLWAVFVVVKTSVGCPQLLLLVRPGCCAHGTSLKQNATTILWNASAYSSYPPDTARNTKAHRSRSTLRPKRKQQQVSVCLDPPAITTYHGRSTHL